MKKLPIAALVTLATLVVAALPAFAKAGEGEGNADMSPILPQTAIIAGGLVVLFLVVGLAISAVNKKERTR